MSSMASQITSLTIVYSTVYSGADHRKHHSSAPLAFVRGIHRGPVNSPHKWPVTRKMFPFDEVIMINHWNRHIAVLTEFSLLTAKFVAILTTSSVAREVNFVKMTTSPFQGWFVPKALIWSIEKSNLSALCFISHLQKCILKFTQICVYQFFYFWSYTEVACQDEVTLHIKVLEYVYRRKSNGLAL